MAFSRVDSVGRHEDDPMRRSALAVAAIGELSHSSGEPFWRAGRAEHWGQEFVLDGVLTWPPFRLSLGEVPMGSGGGGGGARLRGGGAGVGGEMGAGGRDPSS